VRVDAGLDLICTHLCCSQELFTESSCLPRRTAPGLFDRDPGGVPRVCDERLGFETCRFEALGRLTFEAPDGTEHLW